MILGVEIFLIFLGVVFMGSQLTRIRRIELEILTEIQAGNGAQREIAKALQWMVNNWNGEGSKAPRRQSSRTGVYWSDAASRSSAFPLQNSNRIIL